MEATRCANERTAVRTLWIAALAALGAYMLKLVLMLFAQSELWYGVSLAYEAFAGIAFWFAVSGEETYRRRGLYLAAGYLGARLICFAIQTLVYKSFDLSALLYPLVLPGVIGAGWLLTKNRRPPYGFWKLYLYALIGSAAMHALYLAFNWDSAVWYAVYPFTDALQIALIASICQYLLEKGDRPLTYGGGAKAWMIICLIATSLSIALSIGLALSGTQIDGVDLGSIVTAICGIFGYAMLLKKKRSGFLLLAAACLINCVAHVGSELTQLLALGYDPAARVTNIFTQICGLANPLITWLVLKRLKDADAPGAVAQTAGTVGAARAPGGYVEADNMGTRQDSMGQATTYWLVERMALAVKPPFVLYTMPDMAAARAALLELPFIHVAADTNNLICERMMTFGCYDVTEYGLPTGRSEALVSAPDLTRAEYGAAVAAFEKHGGKRKNTLEPEPDAQPAAVRAQPGDAAQVRPRKSFQDGSYFYETYDGPDKAAAMAFLKTRVVTQPLYYVCVYTPEGNFGRDQNGIYQM